MTESRARLLGTDLGSSFAGAFGVTHFLFGDSVPANNIHRPLGADAIAFVTGEDDPDNCIRLDFFKATDRGYQWPVVPPFSLGIFEVPTAGFFAAGDTYVTFSTAAGGNPLRPTRSLLARGPALLDNGLNFSYMMDLSPSKLMNISAIPVDDEWHTVPESNTVLLFGTGIYSRSIDVYLVSLRLRELQLVWYSGRDANGQPRWSEGRMGRKIRIRPCGGSMHGRAVRDVELVSK